jgi:hypothetical protein
MPSTLSTECAARVPVVALCPEVSSRSSNSLARLPLRKSVEWRSIFGGHNAALLAFPRPSLIVTLLVTARRPWQNLGQNRNTQERMAFYRMCCPSAGGRALS